MTNLKVSLKDENQKQKLLQIFKELGHNINELDDQLKGEKWIDIGFQGRDPSTDFRGTGDLGLQNLHYFVTKHNKIAKKILNESIKEDQFYFFACCGINITFHMYQQIEKSKNLFDLYKEDNFFDILERFNRVYFKIFQEFHQYWLNYEQKSNVMHFNMVLIKYFEDLKYIN